MMASTWPAIIRLGQGSHPGLEDHEPARAFKSAQNSAYGLVIPASWHSRIIAMRLAFGRVSSAALNLVLMMGLVGCILAMELV